MDGLLDQVGSVIGDVLNSAPVQLVVLGTLAYVVVVWLATAHWVLRDMRRRRDDPTSPYLAAIGIIVATPILLPISVFTYLVLRPRETVAEARERELTERLDEIGAELSLACPGCRRVVEEDWLTCPACRTRLARRCLGCGRTMGLDWSLCGFCGTEFGRPMVTQLVPSAVRGGVQSARLATTGGAPAKIVARTRRDPARAGTERYADSRREVFEPNV